MLWRQLWEDVLVYQRYVFTFGHREEWQGTALTPAQIIGFEELVWVSNAINNATFAPLKVYGIVALIFFNMCFPLTWYARVLERRTETAK